jgi:peptide/nickel transport system permease protein
LLREMGNRALQMAFVFWVFVTLLFFLLHAAPGDITSHLALDPNLTAEDRRMMIERFGLDRPVHEQYLVYLGNLAQGDLGMSFLFYPTGVNEIIAVRLPRTVVLFTAATVLSYWFGYWLGKVLAWKRGGLLEYSTTIAGVLLYTVFLPWFALIMIWLFAFIIDIFPISGFITVPMWRGVEFSTHEVFTTMIWTGTVLLVVLAVLWYLAVRTENLTVKRALAFGGSALALAGFAAYWYASPMRPFAWDIAFHTILPTATLTLVAFAGTMLLMRTAMLETLREDFILTARAKGLPDKRVRDKHAARTALLPVITTLILSIGFIFSGGIVTETVFGWPGLGEAFLQASVQSDVPLALGCMVILGVAVLIAHLVVDVLYAYLDPRIRY